MEQKCLALRMSDLAQQSAPTLLGLRVASSEVESGLTALVPHKVIGL